MTIERINEGEKTTLKIKGKVDSSNAADFEAVVNGIGSEVKELVLDCDELAYTSSAGLRVVLQAQKKMKEQGKMKLINVSNEVMEILDITGFSDILTVE